MRNAREYSTAGPSIMAGARNSGLSEMNAPLVPHGQSIISVLVGIPPLVPVIVRPQIQFLVLM